MKEKAWYYWLCFILAFIFGPFIESLMPRGIQIDLILICFIWMILSRNSSEYVKILIPAFIFAVIKDLGVSGHMGAVPLMLVVTFIFIIYIKSLANMDNPIASALVIAGTVLLFNIGVWAIYRVFGSTYGFSYMAERLPAAVLPNIIILFVMQFVSARRRARVKREGYISGYLK